jgi:histidinol-phosphate aminotransferase
MQKGVRVKICDFDSDALNPQVFLGNGSDEVLAHTFRALFRVDAPILFPDITYGF